MEDVVPEDVAKFIDRLIALHFEGGCLINAIDEAKNAPQDEETFNIICHLLSCADEDIDRSKIKSAYDLLEYKTNEWIITCVDMLANIKPQRFIFNFTNNSIAYNEDDNKYLLLRKQTVLDLKSLEEIIPEIEREYEDGHKQLFYDDDKDIKVSYDPKTRTIHVGNKVVRFREDAPFTPALCEIMFKNPTKLYELRDFQTIWDDLYDYIGNERPSDWHRVYEVLKRLNERIRNIAGIEDLFELNTKSVRINPKYL